MQCTKYHFLFQRCMDEKKKWDKPRIPNNKAKETQFNYELVNC